MLMMFGNNAPLSYRQYFNARARQGMSGIRVLPGQTGEYSSAESWFELYPSAPKGKTDSLKAGLAGQDVALIQSLFPDPDKQIFRAMAIASDLKTKFNVKSVILVAPFAAYGRSDKAVDLESKMAETLPRLLKAAGFDGIVTAEVHSKVSEQFYIDTFGVNNVSFVSMTGLYAGHIRETTAGDMVIGAPDGADKPDDRGVARATELARAVMGDSAVRIADPRMFKIWKKREDGKLVDMQFSGDVAGKNTVTVDDMSDTCGTLRKSCRLQKDNGAAVTVVYLAHGLFNKKALGDLLTDRMPDGRAVVDRMAVADTVPGLQEMIEDMIADHPDIRQRVEILHSAALFEKSLMSLRR